MPRSQHASVTCALTEPHGVHDGPQSGRRGQNVIVDGRTTPEGEQHLGVTQRRECVGLGEVVDDESLVHLRRLREPAERAWAEKCGGHGGVHRQQGSGAAVRLRTREGRLVGVRGRGGHAPTLGIVISIVKIE